MSPHIKIPLSNYLYMSSTEILINISKLICTQLHHITVTLCTQHALSLHPSLSQSMSAPSVHLVILISHFPNSLYATNQHSHQFYLKILYRILSPWIHLPHWPNTSLPLFCFVLIMHSLLHHIKSKVIINILPQTAPFFAKSLICLSSILIHLPIYAAPTAMNSLQLTQWTRHTCSLFYWEFISSRLLYQPCSAFLQNTSHMSPVNWSPPRWPYWKLLTPSASSLSFLAYLSTGFPHSFFTVRFLCRGEGWSLSLLQFSSEIF
jgi:hypothetical protein